MLEIKEYLGHQPKLVQEQLTDKAKKKGKKPVVDDKPRKSRNTQKVSKK